MRQTATGQLVRITPYQESHIAPLHAAVLESVPEVAPYETWCRPGFTRAQAAEYVNGWRKARDSGTAYYFAVEDAQSGEFLGSCGLSDVSREHRRAGLGYWVRTGGTGRGVATEAARLVVSCGWEDLDLQRIEAEIAVDNGASLRVVEKLGFQREGVLRRRLILPAGPADMVMCALLREASGPRDGGDGSSAER